MADVALDPQNSNPKDLYRQGVRAFVLQDFETAVRAFSKTSELLAVEHGSDIHDSLGDVYLYYGKSLLELSRKESGPLGDGVLKSVEEESEEEEEEEEEEEKPEATKDTKSEKDAKTEEQANGDINKAGDEKTEETKAIEEDADDEKKEDDKKEETKTLEEDKKDEGINSGEANEETEEDLTDLQVAWEVLELAKRIFTNRGDDGKKNLAETLIVLGEISLESGNFSSAVEDMVRGLEIQKKLFSNDSRTIAETYYKLGGAYSTNAQIDEAIESFNFSLEYLQNKVNTLKKDEQNKEANSDEIEELNALIPEIQEKIADMKNLKTEIANKVVAQVSETAPKTNGTSGASSSKQVNDISHLVKRKRKEDDPPEENPAKKPSP